MGNKRVNIFKYKIHPSIYDTKCFYCGTYGEAKDHVPPISYLVCNIERILVRSCLECNTLLGCRALLNLLSRSEYLFEKYKMKYKKLIKSPNWTDLQISELTGHLKKRIIHFTKKKNYVNNKLKFLQLNINNLSFEQGCSCPYEDISESAREA